MQPLSFNQFRFLNKIYKKKLPNLKKLSDYQLATCLFLEDNKFIDSIGDRKNPTLVITQLGESALYEFKVKFHKWWISIILSVIAIIISIVK